MAATGGFLTRQRLFFLAIAVYLALGIAQFIFLSCTFGNGGAVFISLILAVPLPVAVRLCFRRSSVRGSEVVYLTLLTVFVLGTSGGLIRWSYHNGGDRAHAQDVRFAELTRLVREDPAFGNIELFPGGKYGPEVYGTVASQADRDRLESLVKRHGFALDGVDVAGGSAKYGGESVPTQ